MKSHYKNTKKNRNSKKHKNHKKHNNSKKNKKQLQKSQKTGSIKYDNTYFVDSCFILNADSKWMFMDRLYYNLKKLGLKEDPLQNSIIESDLKYLRKHNIVFDTDKCLANYNIPLLFDKKKLKPIFMHLWKRAIDPRYLTIPAKLCNVLYYPHFNNVLLKNELYFNMKAQFPEITKKHMAKTFMINDYDQYEFPTNYILRPIYDSIVNKFLRRSYFINFISNKKEWEDAIEFYDKYNHGYNVIASEYIQKPLLFNGKKCHIRMSHIIGVINGQIYSFLFETGYIYTAEEPYNTTEHPYTRDVHLSQFGGTRRDLIFPKDFTEEKLNVKIDSKDVIKQMRMLLSCVAKLISNKGKMLLENHENGYNIGSVEFLVDQNGVVYLLELMKNHGIIYHVKEISEYALGITYDWITETIIRPTLLGTDPTKHPTYLDPNSV